MYNVFEEKLLSILDRFRDVKPHVLEVVKELRKRGIKIGSTTGYTDKMKDIVVPKAKENVYAPDAWFSLDAVNGFGCLYPYMVFENMKALGIQRVDQVIKVGDTISDIKGRRSKKESMEKLYFLFFTQIEKAVVCAQAL